MVSHAYNKDGVRYAYDRGRSHNRDSNGERYADPARDHNYATKKLYKPDPEFCGVDGEGGNVPEPGTLFEGMSPADNPPVRHQYLSLRCGAELLETGKPLNWWECFDFICDQPLNVIMVAYFFDYDVTMMIRTLPEERVRRLLYRHLRDHGHGVNNFLPVDVHAPNGMDFQIDYLPHKEFKVRRLGDKHWHVINDVGQFFQSSFLKSLDKWDIGDSEQRAMIAKGKSMRSDFAEFTDEIRAYNAWECVLLEQLMTNFRSVCWETGYVPKKWQGPGYLASAMLQRHGVPRRDDIPILKNEQFRALAQAAYYGGRFETTAAGPIRGRVFQYDINGAYVALLRSLPCLIHGSWRRVRNRPDRGLYFGKVRFNHSGRRYLHNLPFRRVDGTIYYPNRATGVYWSCELEAAERAGTEIDFVQGWLYEGHCECRWFDFVDSYYAERVRLGKSAKGYVLKLAGNSIYGKLAQSIGYAPWANPVWAGLITAGCRTMLIDAYSQAPDECFMLATDGLFMGTKLDLPLSSKLGEWEETVHEDGIFIVQPGIYYTGAEAKSRGVERGRIGDLRNEFEAAWTATIESRPDGYRVEVPVDNFITAKQALQRNKWHLAGTWVKDTREITFNWDNKRVWGIATKTDRDVAHRSWPHGFADGFPESTPYKRIIGGNLQVDPAEERFQDAGAQEAARMAEQPDWVEPLFDRDEFVT